MHSFLRPHVLRFLVLGFLILHSPGGLGLRAGTPENSAQEREKEDLAAAELAVRGFLEGCAASDWDKVQPYWSKPLDDRIKRIFGGLTVISVGKARRHALSAATITVPCETRYKRDGLSRKRTLNLKKSKATGGWQICGGI